MHRERYNGRAATVYGTVQNTMFAFTHCEVDGRNIANDTEVHLLHIAGRYLDRALHISL
jgi:hypothetical protein